MSKATNQELEDLWAVYEDACVKYRAAEKAAARMARAYIEPEFVAMDQAYDAYEKGLN
jgi:proline dehydrogenase